MGYLLTSVLKYCQIRKQAMIDKNFPTSITNQMEHATKKQPTIQEIVARYEELAAEEKWFEIEDELFADDVTSTDPPNSPYFGYAEGKAAVRKKGEDFIKKVTGFHGAYTTKPVIGGKHFAVGRGVDITVDGFGRIQIDQIMLYEVRDGQIISEKFFY